MPGVITEEKPVEYFIAPALTDPSIDIALDDHFVSVKERSSSKNTLFVFLPGSFAIPKQYEGIVRKAAALGYHSIGLMYPDLKPVNNICSTTNDTTCHRRARLEIVDGVDRHPDINVNASNCIINRLTKLVLYLNMKYPTQNWGQFLIGDKINWSKVIISGHSQGGANAAVLGKFYPVKKVIMFSIMDFLKNGKLPDWESMPANRGKYFALFSRKDEIIPYSSAVLGWRQLGMATTGDIINCDSAVFPYNHARVLTTETLPAASKGPKYHNSTAMDDYTAKDTAGKYVLDKPWEYLITE
jgi:hypothetical protein